MIPDPGLVRARRPRGTVPALRMGGPSAEFRQDKADDRSRSAGLSIKEDLMGVTDAGEDKTAGLDTEPGEELADDALDDVTGGVVIWAADDLAAGKDGASHRVL